jgi:hypothetical protein
MTDFGRKWSQYPNIPLYCSIDGKRAQEKKHLTNPSIYVKVNKNIDGAK